MRTRSRRLFVSTHSRFTVQFFFFFSIYYYFEDLISSEIIYLFFW